MAHRDSYTDHLSLTDFVCDPYPTYRAWRETDPVLWDQDWQAWLVTGFAEVEMLLKSPALSSELFNEFAQRVPGGPDSCPVVGRHLRHWILYLDEPRHQHLRTMVAAELTPAAVRKLTPLVELAVQELVASMRRNGPAADLVADFALPLTAGSLFGLMGGKHELPKGCLHWAERFAKFIGCEEQNPAMVAAAEQVVIDIEKEFEERLAMPCGHLLGSIDRQAYSHQEILAMCSQLMLAGQDTTAGLVANGMLALLRQPSAHNLLRQAVVSAQEDLIEGAVEELLRFDCPSQLASRRVIAPLSVGGHTLKPGQLVNLFMGAANRDPARFPDPDQVQLERRRNRHLAFGRGSHFCVGAAFARLQGQIALAALLEEFPKMRLLQRRFPREENLVLRSLKTLRVQLW